MREKDISAMPAIQNIPVYRLSTVLERTGLKADTVRAWERRYGLPAPQRTKGGHRLYSRRDIATLQWLTARLEEGLRISAAVALWRELSDQGQDPLSAWPWVRTTSGPPASPLDHIRAAWLNACLAFDESGARQLLNQSFALHDVETVCLQVLCQGLYEIGELWYRDRATVQQEHFTTELAVRRLHALMLATPPPTRPETVLVAMPPGEQHGVPALLLTLMLRRRGLQVLYLGADVPAERLNRVLEDARPAALVLSAQMLSSAAALRDTAQAVLGSGIPVGYGGRIFNIVPETRRHIPGYFLGETLETGLSGIEMLLSEDIPAPEVPPSNEALAGVRDALLQAGDGIAFDVKQRMAALGAPATAMDTALRFTRRQLLAALSLGDLDFMQGELTWVEGLLQHRRVASAMLPAFWRAYREAIVQHAGAQGQVIADWLAEQPLGNSKGNNT